MVAAPIWNAVAEQGDPQTWLGRAMFSLPEDEMQEYQDELADSLEKRGWDPTVVQSFLVVAPLLLEREAISRAARVVPKIRPVLPEVLSVQGAAALGTMEYFLDSKQANQLTRLLARAMQSTIFTGQDSDAALASSQ
jgi:hypothetical protein